MRNPTAGQPNDGHVNDVRESANGKHILLSYEDSVNYLDISHPAHPLTLLSFRQNAAHHHLNFISSDGRWAFTSDSLTGKGILFDLDGKLTDRRIVLNDGNGSDPEFSPAAHFFMETDSAATLLYPLSRGDASHIPHPIHPQVESDNFAFCPNESWFATMSKNKHKIDSFTLWYAGADSQEWPKPVTTIYGDIRSIKFISDSLLAYVDGDGFESEPSGNQPDQTGREWTGDGK